MVKNIVIGLLLFSLMFSWGKMELGGLNGGSIAGMDRTEIRKYLLWAFGPDWRSLTNDKLISRWNDMHHDFQISSNDTIKPTLITISRAYVATSQYTSRDTQRN